MCKVSLACPQFFCNRPVTTLISSYFLAFQRRMSEIEFEEFDLLEKRFAHLRRGVLQRIQCSGQVVNLHRECLDFLEAPFFFSSVFIEAIISSALLNGPKVRPCLIESVVHILLNDRV